MTLSNFTFAIGSWTFGWTHDQVFDSGDLDLERWIVWLGVTLRVHKFHKSDDDRAFHDHPWWFVTFPLQTYTEDTPSAGIQTVAAWRPHYRAAAHQHIVHLPDGKPVWTLILTGKKQANWGFWQGDKFIPHEDWLRDRGTQG